MPKRIPHRFAAIDFETADYGRDSACSLAIITVDGDEIVSRWHRLIKPPRQTFEFTYLHGIGWKDVKDQPTFGELWPEILEQFKGIQYLVAHNATFDREVMNVCCIRAGVAPTPLPYKCTVQLARKIWNIRPTKLPDVCRFLSIELRHHQAESDAEACARIMLASFTAPVLEKKGETVEA